MRRRRRPHHPLAESGEGADDRGGIPARRAHSAWTETHMSKQTIIRPIRPADRKDVLDLNTRAFRQKDEARIVEQLEKEGSIWLELVAEQDRGIVGHILFFPIGVLGKLGALGLGPMSVDPKLQKKGIGSMLVRAGLAEAQQANVPIVFVLGHEK